MALTMDDAGRIGIIAVYTGDQFPDPDNHLADLRATVKLQVAMHALASAAIAHYERVTLPHEVHPLDSIRVHFEARNGRPLSITFPYRIRVKLSGDSEITQLAAVTRAGSRAMFPAPARQTVKSRRTTAVRLNFRASGPHPRPPAGPVRRAF